MGTIRLGTRTGDNTPPIRDFLPLARLDDLVFGASDIFPDNTYQSAVHADVLTRAHLDPIREEMEAIVPMPGVLYPEDVRRLHGTHVKKAAHERDMLEQVRADIRAFQRANGCTRAVAVWCGSTEQVEGDDQARRPRHHPPAPPPPVALWRPLPRGAHKDMYESIQNLPFVCRLNPAEPALQVYRDAFNRAWKLTSPNGKSRYQAAQQEAWGEVRRCFERDPAGLWRSRAAR